MGGQEHKQGPVQFQLVIFGFRSSTDKKLLWGNFLILTEIYQGSGAGSEMVPLILKCAND
jgi:hypothetical protein